MRVDVKVAIVANGKVSGTPACNVIELGRIRDLPLANRLFDRRSVATAR
jgi:hypothetical protein